MFSRFFKKKEQHIPDPEASEQYLKLRDLRDSHIFQKETHIADAETTNSNPNRPKRNIGLIIAQISIAVVALACFGILAACGIGFLWVLENTSLNQISVASDLPDPDIAFYTGASHGLNVFIWECFKQKRVAVFKSTGEYGYSSKWERQEAACGELTAIEKSIPEKDRKPTDVKYFWGTR